MSFGLFHVIAGLIVAVIVCVNLLFARDGHLAGDAPRSASWLRVLLHGFGVAACVLMVVPLGLHRFVFASPPLVYVYMTVNIVCLAAYVAVFMRAIRISLTRELRAALIALATVIFLISSLTLTHYYLLAAGLLFLLTGLWTNRRRRKA